MHTTIDFAKGHATENDFIIIPDTGGGIDLDPDTVAALCSRRAGIGADGLLRVTRAANIDGHVALGVDPGLWFMDYRNADGSIAEMCGNGVRLFAHWLYSRGLVDSAEFTVGTRAGVRRVAVLHADERAAEIRVDMGPAEVTGVSTCEISGRRFAGLAVDLGNPHLACVVPGLSAAALAEFPLHEPDFDGEFFPDGVNVELLTELRDGAVDMRVWERGVGETRSCGTGTVAAARAALADAGRGEGTVTVRVPGGEVKVEIGPENSTLSGPSAIIALGTVDLQSLR